ncbi:shikimate kinase [Algoriphagus halophytocola]|uniref:Shikimate kinase n=1 Tax=Algoriphagus halophytocola TaxID=2991499 RepID=A0ABY6MI51_9BACT|nr:MULTISPECIES: shikimate kinase [unclassified Algoriphagus]UZD22705.1 shikimate kinase [Algoriphagus sp. TR-M5]WBL43970.1 shikimate kinase [Algoriphagus sp. TR-M9]
MGKFLKIVLVGLPGSGKSTFGVQLAKQLNLPFYDLDQLIELNYSMKISEIFSHFGEGKFREWETATLKNILSKSEAYVLASGGGCPCFNDNMDLINEQATSVYLDVPLDEISARLRASKANVRPMFKNMDQGEITLKLKSLLVDRDYFYNQAKIKLSGEDFSAELLVSELIRTFKS